jgi:hypothetical protein
MINQTPASELKFQRTAPTQRMSKKGKHAQGA